MTNNNRKVIPGDLTREERDASPFLIWNTDDDFDSDPRMRSEYGPIMGFHRMKATVAGVGHWYLPFAGEPNRYESYATEREAFIVACKLNASKLN